MLDDLAQVIGEPAIVVRILEACADHDLAQDAVGGVATLGGEDFVLHAEPAADGEGIDVR